MATKREVLTESRTFQVIGERRGDKTMDEIAEEIEQLAHDLRANPENGEMLVDAIMHLAADIKVSMNP